MLAIAERNFPALERLFPDPPAQASLSVHENIARKMDHFIIEARKAEEPDAGPAPDILPPIQELPRVQTEPGARPGNDASLIGRDRWHNVPVEDIVARDEENNSQPKSLISPTGN